MSRGRSSGSAGWPCATACSSTGRRTGPPRCARPTARSTSPPAPSRACAPPTACRACAASLRLGEAIAVIPLVKRALPEARLPFQDAASLGVAAGATIAGALLKRRVRGGAAARRRAAVISLAPALFALRGGELAAYHGVEHKAIAAYEQDADDARDAAKEHERCGSHLVAPMIASNLAGTLLLRRVVERPSAAGRRRRRAGLDGGRRRGLRLVRAQRRHAPARGAAQPGLRAPARDRHARARRAPARGRPRGARRDPPRRGRREPTRVTTPFASSRELADCSGGYNSCASQDSGRPSAARCRSRATPTPDACPMARRRQSIVTALVRVGQLSDTILTWAPDPLHGRCIVFFIWRTMKLMPRTKPQEIKPDVQVGDRLGRRRRRRRGQGRAAGGRRVPARPQALPQARRQGPAAASSSTARPAPARRCSPRPSPHEAKRQLLLPVGRLVRRDVRRPRRGPHPAPVRRGAQERAGDHLHRRDRRRRRRRAARTTTPSASRRSTSCSSRWTAWARPTTSS